MVEVVFDPQRLDYAKLLAHAIRRECDQRVFTRSDAQHELARAALGDRAVRSEESIRLVEDQKYYLGLTPLRHVPMTATQATRINADVDNARAYLSPRQLLILDAAEASPEGWPLCVDQDLMRVWESAWSRVATR